MKFPCKGCTDRTITCHGVCKRYKEWKKEIAEKNKWLHRSRPVYSDRAKQRYRNNVRNRARGWTGRRYGGDPE